VSRWGLQGWQILLFQMAQQMTHKERVLMAVIGDEVVFADSGFSHWIVIGWSWKYR
jgi:hypothetical protein